MVGGTKRLIQRPSFVSLILLLFQLFLALVITTFALCFGPHINLCVCHDLISTTTNAAAAAAAFSFWLPSLLFYRSLQVRPSPPKAKAEPIGIDGARYFIG